MPTPLVRIAADYDCSRLLRQTPGNKGIWDAVRFTVDEVLDCDYFVMLNNCSSTPVKVNCPRGHLWCLVQEPYVPGLHDWMIEGHANFARVFTHHRPRSDPKYVRSQPALEWWVDFTYDELVALAVPAKTKAISFIASDLRWLPGHRKRSALREFLGRAAPGKVDLFGRGISYLEDKWTGLAPYRYSIAVENCNSPDYWTEKIADCFLSWTIPLYDGCPNLEDYFPADSVIRIDASDQMATLARINQLLRLDEWERRLPALQEARRRVLESYQLFPVLVQAIRSYGSNDRERTLATIAEFSGPSVKSRMRFLAYRARERIRERRIGDFFLSRLQAIRQFQSR